MAFKDTLKVPFVQPTVKIIETDQCCNCAGHNYKRNTVTVGIKLNIKYIQISVAGLGSQCGPCKEPICFSVSASVSGSTMRRDCGNLLTESIERSFAIRLRRVFHNI